MASRRGTELLVPFPVNVQGVTRDHLSALAEMHRGKLSDVVRTFILNGLDAPDAIPRYLPEAETSPLVQTSIRLEPSIVRRIEALAHENKEPVKALARWWLEEGCRQHPVPPEVIERHRARRVEEMGIEPTTSQSSPSTLAALRRPTSTLTAGSDLTLAAELGAADAAGNLSKDTVPENRSARAPSPRSSGREGRAPGRASTRARAPHPHGVKADLRSKSRAS